MFGRVAAVDVEAIRLFEVGLVAVRRCEPNVDGVALRDQLVVDLDHALAAAHHELRR
jgi:hypothetical protein